MPKNFVLPTFPAVLATRGSAIAPLLLGWALSSRFANFDEMVDGIEDAMPEIHKAASDDMGGMGFDLILAGFSSARSGAETYYMTTIDLEERGYADAAAARGSGVIAPEAYKLVRLEDSVYFMPEIHEAELAAAGLNERLAGCDRPAAARETLRTGLELQRRKRFAFGGADEPINGIGGAAVMATVRATSVVQEVICRWGEDKIGELIDPPPIDWKARRAAVSQKPDGAQMSRQQRRYLERQQRKKRA